METRILILIRARPVIPSGISSPTNRSTLAGRAPELGEGSNVCRRRSRTGRCGSPPRRRTTPRSPAATRGLPDPAQLADAAGHDELRRGPRRTATSTWCRPVDLTPRRSRDLDAPRPAPGTVQLDVDVPPDEDAVVLLERDGVYSWHLPVDTGRRTRSLEPGPQTRRFEIDVQPVPAHPPPRRPTDRRDRGLLGSVVEGAAHALVFRFVAPALLEKAVEKMEAHVKTGLVHLTDVEVSSWKRFETLDELHLPTDRPVRVLLFIHGTFSSTAGGFGCTRRGRERPGLPAHGDLGVRRRHRLRPQDPQRRPEAERRGPAEAAADPPARRRARHRHRSRTAAVA